MKQDAPLLIIDDDIVDVMALQRAFAGEELPHPLTVAKDGREGLNLLLQRRERGEELPALILLDLRMPKMSGIEFLRQRQLHPELTTIPVIVLSTSVLDADREACRRSGATAYMRKPSTQDGYGQLVRALHGFWTLCE